jgi:hypothetical protein
MKSFDRQFPFVSTTQTGTGSEQSIAHGLGAIPDYVLIDLDSTSSKTYIKGTHTTTHVKVTVTNGATYKVYAGLKG